MFGDDDDFTPAKGSSSKPAGGSKLSSLFAAEDSLTNPNISLGYSAAKKPTKPAQPPTPIGQRAVAILRTHLPPFPHPTHLLVAYEPSSQRQDTSTPIVDLTLTLTPNYASFYDPARHCYAINAPQEQLEALAKHVAMAKHAQAALTSPQPPLVIQDLTTGSGDRGAGQGDHVKVKYSMYLTSPTHPKGIGALVGHVGSDEKPKQVRLGGKKELAGVEAGLVGIRKGGRRFLVIPPHLGYGGQQAGSIPPHSTLLVEVTSIKVKYADPTPTTTAPSPTPSPSPTPTPTPAAILPSPSLPPPPAPGGAPLPPPSPTPSDDDEQHRRSEMTRKMAHMGFRVPGLPGAMDPEHLRVERAEETRRGSVDSRMGEGEEVPSPALSSVSVATSSAPPLHLPPVASAPQPFMHHQHQQHQHAPPPQNAPPQPQQLTYQQPQHPSASYYQQQQQQQPPQQQQHASYYSQPSPPTMQPPHGAAPQPSNPYSSAFSSSSPYPYAQDGQYNNAPSPSHHISPSHTPHPQPNHAYQSYPGGPTHHHSSSLSHLPPSSFPSASSPLLQSLDSKLDSLLSSFAQQSRMLGTHNPSLMYDAPMSPAHIIRALQSLLSEREEWKGKADDRERRVAELQTKVASLQERMEKASEESARLMERRYEAHADEMKAKSGQVVELQAAVRRAEHELQQAAMMREEMEGRVARLEEDLTRAKEEGRQRAEFERQVGLLQVQLRQANEAVVGKEQEGRLVMEQRVAAKESEIAALLREAAATKEEEARERAALQSTIDSLKQQLQQVEHTADERIQLLSAALATAEDERTRLQGEVESSHAALERLQQSTVPQAVHAALQDELAAATLRVREVQREVEEAREETASIIEQARSRREADRAQFLQLLEQAKAEEYERGQAETMEEAKASMQAMREKARATLDQLSMDKEALEERLKEAEQEKEELVVTSRAYIDRLKAQMQAKLQEAADEAVSGREAEAEQAEATKQAALKAVYGGVSRQLQAKGDRRWRPQEVAMIVRAEVQFALTGERPEVELGEEEQPPPPPPSAVEVERQLPPPPAPAVPVEEVVEEKQEPLPQADSKPASAAAPAAKDREEVEEVKEQAKEEAPAALPEEVEPQRVEEKSDEQTHAEQTSISMKEETSSQSTSVQSSDASPTEEAKEEAVAASPPVAPAEAAPRTASSPSPEVTDASPSAETASASVPEAEVEQPTSSLAPPPASAAVDQNGQVETSQPELPPVPTPASPSPATEETHAAVPPVDSSHALSSSVNPSDTNGVDVTNTFEYPQSGSAIPAPSSPAAVKEGGGGGVEEEEEDRLAPLRPLQGPALSVDPSSPTSSSSTSTITPPTPTLLTPPAAAARQQLSPSSEPNSAPNSAPSSTRSRPASSLMSDPFAAALAEEGVAEPEKPRPVVAAPPAAVPAAKRASTSSLFADDDEDDGGLFAAPVKKPVTATKVTPVKRGSLFGDDDDDDGGLFKR